MPQFEFLSETEIANAWQFAIQVLDDRGALRKHTLTLSWADYNLWSRDGGDEPVKVAEAVVMFLLSKMPAAEMGEKFDASIARRKSAQADADIPAMIRR